MSMLALDWAFDLPDNAVPAMPRLLLLAYADHANDSAARGRAPTASAAALA